MYSILYCIDKGILPGHMKIDCRCGWLLMTNQNLTSIYCSNPDCPIHNSHKMANALKVFNIKASIADKRALDLMLHFKLDHHMEIFNPELYTKHVDSKLLSAFTSLEIEKRRLDKAGIFLHEFIEAFDFDNLGETRCKLIFIGNKDPMEFYNKFEGESSPHEKKIKMSKYIGERLKTFWYSDTVRAITNTLLVNRRRIERISRWFKFKNVYDETLYIAITGEISQMRRSDGTRFKPRETIADYWSKKYGINILTTSVSKKHVQYLIMDTDMTNHGKFSNATSFGITILTSKEMDELLQRKYGDNSKLLEELENKDNDKEEYNGEILEHIDVGEVTPIANNEDVENKEDKEPTINIEQEDLNIPDILKW